MKKINITDSYAKGKSHTRLVSVILVLVALMIVFFTATRQNIPSPTMTQDYLAPDSMPREMGMVQGGIDEDTAASNEMMKSTSIGADIMPPTEIFDTNIPRDDVDAKIIKNGSLNLNVSDVDDEAREIGEIARSNNGDVMNANFDTYANNLRSGFLTVKVPVDAFDTTFEAIKKRGTLVTNESITTRDVTEQVIDTESDLKNARALEEELRGFLERAENVTELIAVEKELSRVRGQIERTEAQLKNLTNQTTFSTITVYLTEDSQITQASPNWRPGQVATSAVNALVAKFQYIVDSSIRLVISSLPIFLLSLIGLWFVYLIGRKVILVVVRRMENRKDQQ